VSWPELHPRAWAARLVPTRRALAIGLGVLLLGLAAYLFARETSLFAISRIEVEGGSPQLAGQVRKSLAPLVGRSLVGLDGSALVRRVDALPTVVSSSYDRAFPHTLRISIVPERPAAVLRRGPRGWLLSARGRVIQPLSSVADPKLPRIWVSARTPVRIGAKLAAPEAGVPARAVGLAGTLAARVATASLTDGAVVFHLRSGLQLVLGGAADIRLKVAVAKRALAVLPAGSTFLDVSVPGRPVSGTGAWSIASVQGSSRG
jgi:cell division protein FtsQ